VIGLLEKDVGADAGGLEPLIFLHGCGGDVDIYAPDRPLVLTDTVDGLKDLKDIVQGAVLRILAGLKGQALVAHPFQDPDLLRHFLH